MENGNGMSREKIIDKIRKLLALSASPNENEAALAAEKAQAMLAEYNLHISEVEAFGGQKLDKFVMDSELQTKSRPWQRTVCHGVAQMYFCSYFYSGQYKATGTKYVKMDAHTFVGTEANVVIARMMSDYLIKTVQRLAVQGMKDQSDPAAYRTSFRNACVRRLYTRMMKRIEEAKRGEVKTDSGKNLPALLSMYEDAKAKQAAYIEAEVGKLKEKASRMKTSDVRGMLDGAAAGDRIGLDQQVGGAGSNTKRIAS